MHSSREDVLYLSLEGWLDRRKGCVEMEVPVYLFSGFMDSGKSTLIKETLIDGDFGKAAGRS